MVMGLRIRHLDDWSTKNLKKNLKIVCAAESRKREKDIYIDHDLHYLLASVFKVLHTNNEGASWYFGKRKRR